MRYDWIKLKKELEDRLEKAVPPDLKGFVSLVEAKGWCDFCRQKNVLVYNRNLKMLLCNDCHPAADKEYTATEYDDMWQLAQDTLFYVNEIIMELMYPNLDFSSITPDKMKRCLVGRGWVEVLINNRNVWKFSKEYKSVDFGVFVPAHSNLYDFHQAVEIVIETVSKVENMSRYDVFKEFCGLT